MSTERDCHPVDVIRPALPGYSGGLRMVFPGIHELSVFTRPSSCSYKSFNGGLNDESVMELCKCRSLQLLHIGGHGGLKKYRSAAGGMELNIAAL